MPIPAPDPNGRRAALIQARARIDRELAALDTGGPTPPPASHQDERRADLTLLVPLKVAAHSWGISGAAAWKRARKLEPTGLAVRLRPGGWRVSIAALPPVADTTR